MSEHDETIYRPSSGRVGKMMAILCGTVLVGGILGNSAVASPNSPLKPGEGGTSEFIPGEPGTYYYICTVPGHREQGMVGTIIVE